jgi:hypothetical protein
MANTCTLSSSWSVVGGQCDPDQTAEDTSPRFIHKHTKQTSTLLLKSAPHCTVVAAVKRPPNAFLLYAQHHRQIVANRLRAVTGDAAATAAVLWDFVAKSYHPACSADEPTKRGAHSATVSPEKFFLDLKAATSFDWRNHTTIISNAIISRILGRQWAHLKIVNPKAARAYTIQQDIAAHQHMLDNPDYKFRPKKRKRDAFGDAEKKLVGRPRKSKAAKPDRVASNAGYKDAVIVSPVHRTINRIQQTNQEQQHPLLPTGLREVSHEFTSMVQSPVPWHQPQNEMEIQESKEEVLLPGLLQPCTQEVTERLVSQQPSRVAHLDDDSFVYHTQASYRNETSQLDGSMAVASALSCLSTARLCQATPLNSDELATSFTPCTDSFSTHIRPPEPGTEEPLVRWYNEVVCSTPATNNHTIYVDQIINSPFGACNGDTNDWSSTLDNESGYASSGGATLISSLRLGLLRPS